MKVRTVLTDNKVTELLHIDTRAKPGKLLVYIYKRLLSVCLSVCVCIRGWRPNRWTDRHQTWHEGRGPSGKCFYVTGSDVTQPEQGDPPFLSASSHTELALEDRGIIQSGRIPCRDIKGHIPKPEVTSRDRK